MSFNAARQPFAFSAIVSGILAALFAVRYVMAPGPLEKPFTGGMPFAAAITEFSIRFPWVAAAIAGLLIIWILFILVQLTIRYASVSIRNYLSIQFFMIAACGIIVPGEALAAYAATLLLLLSMRQFIATFHKEYRFGESFRGGLYLGFLPLLYAPSVVLLLLAPIAMSLYRRSYREFTVCVFGMLLPLGATGFVYWAAGGSPWLIYAELWRCAAHGAGILPYATEIPVTGLACLGLLALLATGAVLWFLSSRKGMRTRQRKVMGHVSFLFILVLASFALPGSSATGIPVAAAGIAMAAPYAFSVKRTAIPSVLYCIILISVLALNMESILVIFIP